MSRLVAALVFAAGCAHATANQPLLLPVHVREHDPAMWRTADDYIETHQRELKLRPGGLRRAYSRPTTDGFFSCYQQLHRGVPVADSGLCLTSANGTMSVADTRARGLHLSVQPPIDAEEVKQLVTRITGFKIQREPELYVLLPGKFGVPATRLAWRVQRWMGGLTNAIWIDATNGRVLEDEQPAVIGTWNCVHSCVLFMAG